MFPQRLVLGVGVVLCGALIGAALYMQHVVGLEPCNLCIFQRVLIMVLGAVLLVAFFHNPSGGGRRVYGGLAAVAGLVGAGVAGRHVWLQNLPEDEVPECGPGLDYLMDAFPLMEAMEMVFRGSGECAEVQWTFLGLSIPGWTLVVFCCASLVAVLTLIKPSLLLRPANA